MKRLLVVLATAAALWSAACGSGSAVIPPPPPVGKFSLASLNGTYAFVTNGEVFTGGLSATPLARVGSFTADGKGGITDGVEDTLLGTNAGATPSGALTISSGSYTVGADGRGALTLNITSNGVTSSINFGIVLTSTSDGLLIDETSNANQASTGSGNFIKQNSGSFAVASAAGTYVFDFSGLDGSGNPDSIVGEFSANNGVISAGVQDENDNGNLPSTPTPISFVGSMAQDPLNTATLGTFGRGIAQLNGLQYVFYIVDGTRIRFLSASGGEMLAGDAVIQNNPPAALNSGFAFIVAGSSGSGGVTRVGRFTANGASVTSVLLDTNNAGAFHQTNTTNSASISLDSANPGRGTITFTDPTLSVPFTFVFYLSSATSGVIQDVSQSNKGATDVADGSLVAQSGSPFSSSNITGTYAMNWSGLSLQNGGSFSVQDEEDLVAQATVSNLNLTGAADIFQFQNGVPVPDLVVSGSITAGGDGTGGGGQRNTMNVKLTKSSSATVNFVVYFVNPQLGFFANNQGSTRIVAGILKTQQ
jgi:fibronectin-binding autotransporter adhesin